MENNNIIVEFLNNLWLLTLEMAPWLLLGFLFSGILKVLVPQQQISKHLGSNSLLSSMKATLFGIPLPLCSCGVIPTGISLRNNGASKAATNAFLIATPQTGVDSIFATFSLLGLPYAIARPIIALLTGVFGGYLTTVISDEEAKETIIDQPMEELSNKKKLKEILHYGFVEMVQDISKWLIIGLLIAALITTLLPTNFFTEVLENYFLQMLIMLLVSIPMYVCATGSIPIAVALLAKGLAPGLVLLFLMAGPATNSATLSVLFSSLGKKSTFIYLFAIFFGAIFSGLLIDFVLYDLFVSNAINLEGINHSEHHSSILGVFFAISLVLILIFANLEPILSKKDTEIMNETSKLNVEGMTCNHCKASVEKNVSKIKGIKMVNALPKDNLVEIDGKADLEEVKKTIQDLGFTVKE